MEQPPTSSRRPPPAPRARERASSGARRQKETSHRGSQDQGPASPVGSQPVSPRGSITGLASPGLLSPSSNQFSADGAARFQPSEVSSNAVYGGGTKPDSLFDPLAGQLQPDGSSLSGSEDRMVGRPNQTLPSDMGKDQPEGSGGTPGFNTQSVHSLVDLHTLSPTSGSAGPFPSQSHSMKLSQSPSRGALPDLSTLNPVNLGITERKQTLLKAESSDHIYRTESQWTISLPKAISSDYLSWGKAATPVPSMLSKHESEELLAYTQVHHCPKSHDLNVSVSSNSGSWSSEENFSTTSASTFGSSQINHSEAFRITVVTWNVGSAMPPNDVTSLLHLNAGDSNDTDMIAIGLQEVNSMINKRLKDALFTDQWSELFMEVLSPFSFVLVSTVRMQGVILMVFAKYYHLPFLHDIQTDCTRTGLGGYWGNKGGVSVRLSIFGHMICFLNCHLPAHMEKAEQRREDFTTILHLQTFEGPTASGILDHDLIFWFGDLNFRIESLDIRFVKYAIDNNILHQLWEKDQLNIAKSSWSILKGFQEGPLNFPPTFKFDIGTNTYDTSAKKRKPAWTDRILWKIKGSGGSSRPRRSGSGVLAVNQLCYCSHMEYTVSDHKPVVSTFAVQFASRTDVPLVEMQVEDEWTKPEQAIVTYKVASTFQRSSWDWIALYRVGFRHCKDYVTYVWAKQEDTESNIFQLMFPEESLPRGKGEYILGYYSNNYSCMVGVTEPFQISLPSWEQGNSSPDSSIPSSDDEDNSTLVLLRAKSRSPSPSKMSQRRSRSPSLSIFQGLLLRSSLSRSPSPQNRRSSALLKSETPSIQLPQSSSRRSSKSQEPASDGGPQLQATWHFDENSLTRAASPRNLGLLPAMRLDTLDQVMGRRRDSADQGPSSRRMSPTSPTSGLAALFGTSPQDRGPQGQNGQNGQSHDAGP